MSKQVGVSEENRENEEVERLENEPYGEFRCFVCRGYLYYGPIRVLPNGRCICGPCFPNVKDTSEGLPYRVLNLDKILKRAHFPCRYENNGCKFRVTSDRVNQHQDVCQYQPFPCLFNEFGNCKWKGLLIDMVSHFREVHPENILNNNVFPLKKNEDSHNILVSENENINYMIWYSYDSSNKNLSYDLRYIYNPDIKAVDYRLHLTDGEFALFRIAPESDACRLLNIQFIEESIRTTVNLRECMRKLSGILNVALGLFVHPSD